MPIPSGGMNDLPAWLASRPRTRSASVGWPHDSCEAMPATCGPATRSILPSGDFGELSLLRDRPVHLDRVFVREGDLRLAPRGLGDLDGVVHDGTHIGLRPQVRGREPEGPIDEDPHAHAAILADVESVEDSV